MKSPLIVLLSASVLLTGCGGSDGQTPTSTSPIPGGPLVGHFTDSPVEGLTYTTESQSGITDASGAFKYNAGETIQFSIGNLLLGAPVSAVAEMTPVDLIPGVVVPTTASKLKNFLDQSGKKPGYPAALAFNKLHNAVTFLQALDSDKDASNGITIAAGIGALLNAEIDVEGISLDFDQSIYDFRREGVLTRLLAAAQSQNLVDSTFVQLPGRALDHFYDAQGISHSIMLAGSSSSDTNADGTADEINTYTYDSNGNQLTYSYDSDGNGTANTIYTYTYDSNGNQLTSSYDSNADGTADSITTRTFDSNGNRLTSSYDNNGDGTANTIYTNTYDSNGNQLTYSRDSNGNGTANTIYTNTYDSNGNQLTSSYDSNVDGTADKIYTFAYDSNGNQLTSSYDGNADGTANSITTYTFDSNGNRLTNSRDSNVDGTADRIITYTYDSNGNRLTYSRDSNADGTANSITTSTFDSNGNQLTFSEDNDADGTADYITTYTYVPGSIGGYMQWYFDD
jgi:hypothetical protein